MIDQFIQTIKLDIHEVQLNPMYFFEDQIIRYNSAVNRLNINYF